MLAELRYHREEVEPSFWRLWEALIPTCEKVGSVGSYRRRESVVSELDLLVLPFYDRHSNLFEEGAAVETHSALDSVLAKLVADNVLRRDEDVKRDGDLYKRFRLVALGIGVDIFIARPANYGYLKAIRTGPQAFSKAMVTGRQHGGLRPANLRCNGGFVWRQERDRAGVTQTVSVPITTEEALFDLWGMPCVPARDREAGLVTDLRTGWGLPAVPFVQSKGA